MTDDAPQTMTDGTETHNPIDQDKFCQTIRSFPIIWDSSHSEYKNKQLRNATWDYITKIMAPHNKKDLQKEYRNRKKCCKYQFDKMKQNRSLTNRGLYFVSKWSFFTKDYVQEKQHTNTSDGKDVVGEIFENERQNKSTGIIREYNSQTDTGLDVVKPAFTFENVKRRKLGLKTNHGSERKPQATKKYEEMKGDYDDTNYYDQSNHVQTNIALNARNAIKISKMFYTKNGGDELPFDHSRSWKQCRTALKDQYRNFLSVSTPILETGVQQKKPADEMPELVLETAGSGDTVIDPDEETRMNEELREKYLNRKPSTTLSGQNTSPEPQKSNKDKISVDTKVFDLTDEDLNDSEYEENNEGNYGNYVNSDGDSNQLDGDENLNIPLINNGGFITKEANMSQDSEDEVEMRLLEPDEGGEKIGDNLKHTENEQLQYMGKPAVNIDKKQSGNSSQHSLGVATNLTIPIPTYLHPSQCKDNAQSQEETQEPVPRPVGHRRSTSSLDLMYGETSKLPLVPNMISSNNGTVDEYPRIHTQEIAGVALEENNITNFQSFVKNSLDQHIQNFDAQKMLEFKISVLGTLREFINR